MKKQLKKVETEYHDCPKCGQRCNCEMPFCEHCMEYDKPLNYREDYYDTDCLGNCFSDADPGL